MGINPMCALTAVEAKGRTRTLRLIVTLAEYDCILMNKGKP